MGFKNQMYSNKEIPIICPSMVKFTAVSNTNPNSAKFKLVLAVSRYPTADITLAMMVQSMMRAS
jgi:hypothetical protein